MNNECYKTQARTNRVNCVNIVSVLSVLPLLTEHHTEQHGAQTVGMSYQMSN